MRARPLRDAGGAAHGAGRGVPWRAWGPPRGWPTGRGVARMLGGLAGWHPGLDSSIRGWAAPCGGGEPPTKVGGLREDILFKSKEYPLALPKKDCQGGWRRHKLHIPRRCPEGTGSLIPLLLLFPPQNFAVGALYFPPDNPLETTKGEACGPLLWKPLGGWTKSGVTGDGGTGDEGWGRGAWGHSGVFALGETKLRKAW